MKAKFFILFALVFLTAFLRLTVSAQSSNDGSKIYDKDGLSFSYPTTWELIDQSTVEMQQFKTINDWQFRAHYINSPRYLVTTDEQLFTVKDTITDRFIRNISRNFGGNDLVPVEKEYLCTQFGEKKKPRAVMRGVYQNQPATAEIYHAVLEHRFLNLVFIRNDNEADKANPAWHKINETLKVITPNAERITPKLPTYTDVSGVLNGKAVSLPIPGYPPIARQRRARGEVKVRVTIDEAGR
jgi:hypothetical protein